MVTGVPGSLSGLSTPGRENIVVVIQCYSVIEYNSKRFSLNLDSPLSGKLLIKLSFHDFFLFFLAGLLLIQFVVFRPSSNFKVPVVWIINPAIEFQ